MTPSPFAAHGNILGCRQLWAPYAADGFRRCPLNMARAGEMAFALCNAQPREAVTQVTRACIKMPLRVQTLGVRVAA